MKATAVSVYSRVTEWGIARKVVSPPKLVDLRVKVVSIPSCVVAIAKLVFPLCSRKRQKLFVARRPS